MRRRVNEATLRGRLNGLFGLGALLVVLVVAVNTFSFVGLISSRQTLLGRVDPATLQANQLFVADLNEETGVRGFVLSSNGVFLQPYDLGRAQEQASSARLNRLLAGQPALLALARRAEAQGATWRREFAQPAIAAVRTDEGKFDSQAALLKSKSLFDAVRTRITILDNALAARRAAARRGLESATNLLIGTLVAALILVILTGIVASRSLRAWVTEPLESVGSDSRAVAAGDITHAIAPVGPPDFRQHAADLEAMRERIVAELQQAEASRAELAIVNDELGRSNVELEQFAYVASHDLQEPLRKVTSFVQLLRERYKGQLDDRADQYIDFAVDGAKRMQVLINDLLAFSRVGRTTERFETVDLASTVAAAVTNLNSLIEATGAEIVVGALPVVRGDESLLVALWQNLIGNALKFRSEDPPLVRIEAARTEDQWVCSVSDNGIGIEPRFAEKVFVLFQRLHSRDAYEGTGIGLAMSKKIVEFHGGRMWLDESHHPGTRMCLTLPVLGEVFHEHGP
jgi:signal transduction histidine kinase